MICTAINRPLVPTIYPPVAEAAFAAVRSVVPPSVADAPMQVLGLLAALGTTVLLLVALRMSGGDPRRAAWFAWCPFVASEAVTNAHIDGLATMLAVAGTVLAIRGAPIRGGIVLGLAIATKVFPVLVLPPLLRRSPVRILGAAVLTVVAVYVPHVLASGGRVLGYLPGLPERGGLRRRQPVGARLPARALLARDARRGPAAGRRRRAGAAEGGSRATPGPVRRS